MARSKQPGLFGEVEDPLPGSTLPYFVMEDYAFNDGEQDVELTSVTCPRKDCKRTFYLESEPDHHSTQCPYCFKVARFH